MKLLRHIAILFIGATYLLLSSGIVVYKSACSCSGKEHVGIFSSPETCTVDFHKHHKHDDEGQEMQSSMNECHECSSHSRDCGCDSPEIKYYKLMEELIPEKLTVLAKEQLQIAKFCVFHALQTIVLDEKDNLNEYYLDPPPVITPSRDFLIQIRQLKIHCIS